MAEKLVVSRCLSILVELPVKLPTGEFNVLSIHRSGIFM
jgi:hypothetical protein